MSKLFKNCSVIYFKKSGPFTELIQKNDNIFKEKIIISDFQDLKRTCFINGTIHVLNTNPHFIPNEKIDCIVTDSTKNTDIEALIIKHNLAIPILYFDPNKKQQQVWCGICNKIYTNAEGHPLSKYCSEKCMKKENGFANNTDGSIRAEVVKDLGLDNIVSRIIASEKEKENDEEFVLEFDKSLSDKRTVSNIKKTADKFQTSMVKDAIRLDYAFKRETYKREMKQPSLRKAKLSDKKETKQPQPSENSVICKGITKKGKQCTNTALKGSEYCGILSHSMNNVLQSNVLQSQSQTNG